MKTIFPGVFKINGKLCTENSALGIKVHGEKLIRKKGKEFRIWDPFRSKLSAAFYNGLKNFPISQNSNILYLGASAGTTSSHISDITKGMVFCVEFSERMMQELMQVCEKRKNMVPILGDANKPNSYASSISSVDVIYQDVAQKNQAEILIKNSQLFLPKYALLAIKSRSINSVRKPKKIFNQEVSKLREKFNVLEIIDLKPYDKDHVLVNLEAR